MTEAVISRDKLLDLDVVLHSYIAREFHFPNTVKSAPRIRELRRAV